MQKGVLLREKEILLHLTYFSVPPKPPFCSKSPVYEQL